MSERGVGPYVKDVVVLVMIDDGDSGISTGRHETEVVTWGFSSRDEMLHVHVHRVCVCMDPSSMGGCVWMVGPSQFLP